MAQTRLFALAASLCCAITLYASSAAGVELEGQYVTLIRSGEYRMVQDGEGLESLANLVEEVKGAGVEDIVLDTGARDQG